MDWQHDIMSVMRSFQQRIAATKRVDLQGLRQELEPLFRTGGYREPSAGGRQRILLLHDGGAGDFVNLTPALRAVRRLYPQAELTLVCYKAARSLAEACPYLDEVVAYDELMDVAGAEMVFGWVISLAEGLLPKHFDRALCFAHFGRTLLLAYLSGARERIGYDYGQALPFLAGVVPHGLAAEFMTVRVPIARARAQGTHVADFYLGLLEGWLQQPVQDRALQLWYGPEDEARVLEQVQLCSGRGMEAGCTYLALCLGGRRMAKRWPAASYAGLLRRLLAENDRLRFLAVGGKDEQADCEGLRQAVGEGYVLNLAGRLQYRESAAAVGMCRGYLGNDTSILHMAAAFGLPVLSPNCYPASKGLHAGTIPACYYPYGVPAVLVLPAEPLAECWQRADIYGCTHIMEAHCICQVSVAAMEKGWQLLQRLVREGRKETAFLRAAPQAD